MPLSYDELNKVAESLRTKSGNFITPSSPGFSQAIQKVTPKLYPAPQPSPLQNISTRLGSMGKAALGGVGSALNAPSYYTEKFLTGGQGYEKKLQDVGVSNPVAQKVIGTAGRLVFDPLNFLSLGSGSLAKIGLKTLSKDVAKKVGQVGMKKLTQLATKEGVLNLAEQAGKDLATLRKTQMGEKAAQITMLQKLAAPGGENLIAKNGLKVGIPFTGIKKAIPLPDIAVKISPFVDKAKNLIPASVREAAGNIVLKARQVLEYPLNRAPAQISDIVDKFAVQKQKFFDLGDKLAGLYQKSPREIRNLADSVLAGTTKLAIHESPLVQTAIEARNMINNLGQRAVKLGLISPETYATGEGKYLPQLYDIFLKHEGTQAGVGAAKKIAGEEVARTLPRTETEISNTLKTGMKDIQDRLASGKITQNVADRKLNNLQKVADVQTAVFKRFQQAGGQITNPTFRAVKGLQNVGGLVTKHEQFKALKGFGSNVKTLAKDYLKGDTGMKIKPGTVGTVESEFQRHLQDITELAIVKGKPLTETTAKQLAAQRLIANSTDITRGGVRIIRLPESKALGALSGIHVPEGLYTFLTEGWGKFLSSTAGKWLMALTNPLGFKSMKTVYTPGSAVRNIASNQILNFLKDPGSFKEFISGIRVVLNPAESRFQEMEKAGVFLGSIVGEEAARFYNKLGDLSKLDQTDAFHKVYDVLGALHNKLGDIRSFSENIAKAQAYLHARNMGASISQAKNVAEKTIFAYQKIGPAIRIARSTGIPFLTFTIKAVPFVAEQGIKYPGRLAMFPKLETNYLKAVGINEQEQKYLPDYMQGMLPLPGKDKNGNTVYFNPQYIYPWGQVLSSESQQLPSMPLLKKGFQLPGGVSIAPTISELTSQATGRDTFTNQEFVRQSQTPGQQVRARIEHVAKTFSPTPLSNIIQFLPGATGTTQAAKTRGFGRSLLGSMAGIQTQPFNLAQGIQGKQNAIEAIKRETTTEIKRAVKQGRSSSEINALRLRGIERMKKLRGGE